MTIDWTSAENHLLLNPRLPDAERLRLERLVAAAPPLQAHVFLATSGTSGSMKLVALPKRAILASAAAVNQHLQGTKSDVWCCVLPTFHVGGLGIHARAHLSGARVVSMPWDAAEFAATCAAENVTLSALVPAQVHDLVAANLRAPSSLRAIVIGGAAFSPQLHSAAWDLGWPVLASYGMSELCSQVATAVGRAPEMVLLPHVEARAEDDGRLAFRSVALFTGYCLFDDRGEAAFVDPKVAGWFVTEDEGDVEGRILRVRGRRGAFVKIGGESVDLGRLDAIVDEIARAHGTDAALVAVPDERLGNVIHLAVTRHGEAIRDAYDQRVLPFERARGIHTVDVIPRSSLGKLLRKQLLELIS